MFSDGQREKEIQRVPENRLKRNINKEKRTTKDPGKKRR